MEDTGSGGLCRLIASVLELDGADHACCGELNFSAGRNVSTLKLSEVEMSLLLVVCLSLGAPLAGLGLHDLQASLERWDQKRHAAD